MPEQTDSPEGACKRFECKVIGFPRPSIRWYKDGENITTHRRYQFDYTADGCIVLIIDKVVPADQGVYACRAENCEGTAESSALLHVKGGILSEDDELTSVHSMRFRLLDSRKRPLVLEQKRQDSSDHSDDSVLNIISDVVSDVNFDTAIGVTADTENSKWEADGTVDTDFGEDTPDIATDSKVDNSNRNYDDLLAEGLTDTENSADTRSRRWTADSGITSRGSSFSSDPDINIDHESMLEMQKYLHGKEDAIFEPYENDKLKVSPPEDIRKGDTELAADTSVTDRASTALTEFRSDNLTQEQDFVGKENVKGLKMEKGDLAINDYEFYQEDDIGHHFCTSKQNHIDHIETDIDWERVDDHEASVLAGKYLFAHGRDVEGEIHPLSEWEMIKQTEGSQFISVDNLGSKSLKDGQTLKVEEHTKVDSAETSFVGEKETKITKGEIDELSTTRPDGDLIDEKVKEEFFKTEKFQASFSADIQDTKIKAEQHQLTLEELSRLETAKGTTVKDETGKINEITEHTVSSTVETVEASQTLSDNIQHVASLGEKSVRSHTIEDKESKIVEINDHIENIESADEFVNTTDDDESYDLDVDRSEQIMLKKSQQYRRPSARDSLTSEMVDHLSATQELVTKDAEIKTHAESSSIKFKKTTGDNLNAETVLDDEAISTDEDSYELDLDRSEQIIAKRSQQLRRLSAQDRLTKEKVDQLTAKQSLASNDDGINLESETKQILLSEQQSMSDNDELDLDVDRKEDAILARRHSLREQHVQEMETSKKELDKVSHISDDISVESVQAESLGESIKKREVTDNISESDAEVCNNKSDLETQIDGNIQTVNAEGLKSLAESLGESIKEREVIDNISESEAEVCNDKSDLETQIDGNIQTVIAEDLKSLAECLEKQMSDSLEISEEKPNHDKTEQKSVPEEVEQKLNVYEASTENEILPEHEADMVIDSIETVSIRAENKEKRQHVPFEQLSSTKKDEILKQISDITLAKGKKGRQLKDKVNEDSACTENLETNNVDMSIESETKQKSLRDSESPVISDVTASEKSENVTVLDRQLSLTGETVIKPDYKEAETLTDQEGVDPEHPSMQTVTRTNDADVTLKKESGNESHVNEGISSQENEQTSCVNLDSPDPKSVEKAAIKNEDSLSLATIENSTDPVESVYQTKKVIDETDSHSRANKDNLEALDDTKPEVPNIINSTQDLKSKSDIEYKLEEENLSAQEVKNDLTGSGLVEIDNTNLNMIEAKVSKDETGDAVEILTTECTLQSPVNKGSASSAESEDSKKISADTSKLDNQTEQNRIEDVPDKKNESLKDSLSTEKVHEINETVEHGHEEKLEETAREMTDQKQEASEGIDVVDTDISKVVTKQPVEKVFEQKSERYVQEDKAKAEMKKENYDEIKKTDLTSIEKGIENKVAVSKLSAEDVDKHIDITEKVEATSSISVLEKDQKTKIEIESDQITVREGEPVTLKWAISGVSLPDIKVAKDDFIVQPDNRLSIEFDSDCLTLQIKSASLEDGARYSLKGGKPELEEGTITVQVIALETSPHEKRDVGSEPEFVVEPVLEKEDGRRMSIKCSVSGFPQPDVTWYHHGQPLGSGEFWDVYSKDGYHYLANTDSSFLDAEEIVCRVENDAGFIQTVLQLNKKGDEITCEPVQREAACPDVSKTSAVAPHIELQLTETSTKNLQSYTVTASHLDKDNQVTVNEGEYVQLLGTYDTQQWLTRLAKETSKICYVPANLLEAIVATDARSAECKNVAPNQLTEQINKPELQTTDTGETQSASMPERRKIVPGSKLHGSQEDRDRESPTDIESKLGFKDSLDKKKDVSDQTIPEYEDGTSRPMFKKRLKTVVTRTGELVQMECIVRGTPLPKVLWLKNNRPLKESDNCQVIADEETNMLIFPEVSEDDIGVYTARAMNVNGSVMCSAELSLEDGRPLPFSETTESPMDLDFTTPNYFFQMSSCQVAEGRMARFDCRVVAYPRPEIVWMRDGKVVQDGERFRLINMNNEIYSLLIQDVQMSDTGRYTCWARNKFGEAMTEAYLNVIALTEQEQEGDMAPKFLTRFYDQQTTEGMLTDFKCLIAGKPEPSVTWLLDDIELKDGPGMRQRHKDSMVSLEIKSPKIEQSGQYTCQLRNTLGEATCSARLTVIEDKLHGKMLPKFLRKFDHLTIKDGEEAKFSCVIVGEPKADVIWMFDHKPIPDSSRRFVPKRDGDTYSLIVKNARIDDTGVVTCKAVNDEGEVYCSANLLVREGRYGRETPERVGLKPDQKESKFGYVPTFTKRLQDVQVSEGAMAKFECKVMGIPQPEVTWMKDGRVIPSGGRYQMIQDGDTCYLHINNVSMSDTGVYTCIVSNNQGKSSSSAALKMEGLPPKDKYIPEKPVDTYVKKERYTPERKLDDTYTRKTRYTPERFLEDTYAKKRYTPDRFLEDTYAKKRYTPERYFEDTYTKQRYTPDRYLEDTYTKKARYTPDYLEDTYVKRYTPDRYTAPDSYLDQTSLKQPYMPVVKSEAVPKIAYDKPTLLNKTDESVRLSWAPVSTHNLPSDSRRVSYIVESRELPSSVWTKVGLNVPGSSYLVRHLRPDKEYEFRVRAQNQHGISEPTRSSTLEKRVDESRKFAELPEMRAPPRLPTHRPIITDLGEEMVRLAWRPVESYKSKRIPPVSYQLEAKELPGKDWMPISTRLRDTTHYLSELSPDRDYMIRVRAENDFGVSEPTEPLWLPRAKAFPGVPISRPQIVEIEPHKAKLSWSRVDVPAFGLDEVPLTYMLEVEEPPKDWRTLARDLDDTEYIIEGLKPERDYRFRVRAKTPTGVVSEPSPAVSLYTTLAKTIAPVDRLEVLDYEPDTRSLQLQWQRVEIPPYSSDEEPLMYMLEYQEPPLPDWRPLVTGIPTTRYRVMNLDSERDYNFRVRALTPYGVSQPSPALPVTMRQPTAIRHLPENVVISEVESDSLRLTWRRPMVDLAQPISYQVEMLEPLMADWRPIATRVTDTTYKVTGLKPTRDYQFRVIPYADTRALPSTPVVGLTSSPVRPRLHLSEPKIREMGPESVQLSWQPAELPLYQRSRTPMYYGVEMMELPSTNWVPVARRVPDTTYLVSGLRADHDYKFRVTAETDLATSEPSLAAVLRRKPAPAFPRDEPTIRDFTPNAVMLSWRPAVVPEGISLPVTTPVFYSIESQSPPGMGGWTTLAARHPQPSVKLNDLRPDLDYLVRVRAHYNDYISEPTLPVYIPRRAAPPRIPHEEPYPVDIRSDSVKLQWRSADLPVHIMDYAPVTYRIEAQELPGGNWVTVARGVPHTDFKVTGLSPKNDYCFRIRAENDYGVSDPTRPVTVGRRSVAPVLPHDEPLMYDLGSGSVRLSWRPATLPSFAQAASPITYTIFVQEMPFKNWRPHVKRIPQTWYHISGLNPDKEYNFRVQAENEFGTSKPTVPVFMPRVTDLKRPISMPEIDDFDEDLTSVKLHWKPRAGSPFDMGRSKYLIESWEPVKREWYPVARGIPDTSYQLRGLPAAPDHLFRVRLETEQTGLSEPSVPVSVSRFYARRPVHRPQLYELDTDSVRLSWDPAFIPSGQSRRPVRYVVEMREIPDKMWNRVTSDLLDTNYKIRSLRSKSDYEFRVRAVVDGETSEPSMPVALYRRSEIPKVRFDVPEVYDVADDALSLRWNKVDIPTFSYDDEPLSFMIERQTLPGYQWEPVATNLTGSSYRIKDLKPYQDYAFRVRGVYPSGYSEPSPHVPVYRRPIRLSVPIARPEVWEEEPYSARLRWQPAYIPSYHSSRPRRYRIEMQEAGPTATDWQPVANDVTTPDFTVQELSPRKDYNFRIRAEMENGDISEPTPPIQYYRSQLPMSKEPFALGEYKPVEYEITIANRTYVEHLTKYVPPRLPIDKPEMVVINPETVELAWKPARVPDSIRHTSNLTYTIEVRTPPSFEWRELVSGLKQLNHSVKKLHPRIDYVFRIRAWNEYGPSEPSLPVSLYRPNQHDPDDFYDEDEAWEKEWELRFGQQEESEIPLEAVPPKLPMDTPKIITQSPESVWFSWIPARIPAYATQTPITYVIEVKEPPETSWKRQEQGLVDNQFTLEGMNPTRDYHIRVKAETKFGPSEPTLPIIIKRSGSRPGSRRSSMERDVKAEDVTLDTTVLETLTSGVPPRMSSNRPLSSHVQPTSLTLSWPAGRVPSYVKNQTMSYIIEKREPPGHIWTVLAKDIYGTKYDIKGLIAEQDYMFRVRAKNDFGTSDPTLPMTLYRERDDYVPQKIRSRSGSRDSIQALVSRRRRSSSLLDFDYARAGSEEVDACVKDQIPTQPEYMSAPKWDTQYGVDGKKGKIVLQVRGYPLPTVHWYLNDEKLDYGDNYNAFVSASGTVTLEIKLVKPDTMGTYKCYAENEHGSAIKYVKYEFADPPTVLEPLRDLALPSRSFAKFICRVDGFPCPTAKWMKDWHPVKDSSRVKIIHKAPDVWSLEITNALSSDSGLYACTMENIAGKVTMTARLVMEDQDPGPVEVELKKSPIEDSYHILEEIGRSRQGVIRRVIEKQTGKTYAANFIFARNKAQKNFFLTEFEVLRLLNQYDHILNLHDAFETDRSLVLVTELISGTDLLDKVITDGNWTEANAADTIKNLLGVLQILGTHNIQHLDIKPSNIYLSGSEVKDMTLMNFALSRQLLGDEDLIHNYGSIGYASPEQVAEDIITDRTDVWGVGVLAYILLAGVSPFKGANDYEVLNKTKTCDWEFSDAFANFSEEAKDFIGKLLLKNPSERLSVDDCLKHPWLTTTSATKLNNEKLKVFHDADIKKGLKKVFNTPIVVELSVLEPSKFYLIQREASKSFITANLQSFNKILHGASALYQPAMDQDSGEIIFPDTEEYGDFLSEDAWYEWQLHYMDDPDTQNFPLENKDFTVRESRHTSADDDEIKMDKKGSEASDIDSAIMFRNKIQTTSFIVGEDVTFTCTVISPDSPAIVTWYRDEQLLGEDTYRTETKYSAETGEASLIITNLKDYDAAIYKCVARNKDGRVSCEARLLLGDVPGKPGRPVITQTSGSEVFLTWTGPVSDGNSYILGYRIDFKKTDEDKWTRGPFVTDEYALVSGLVPSSEYIFRISCHNKYGGSQYSWASLPVTTGNVDTPKVQIAKYLKPVLEFSSFDKQQLILQAASRRPSLTVATDAKLNEGKPEESYKVLETISKGRYGEYKLCSSIVNNKHYVMKVTPFTADSKDWVMHEFNILCNLRQVNIITTFESFLSGEILYVIFERLSGLNVMQYLCLRKSYSEEVVSRIVRQILDGLQYLQQMGIIHLNLQPSSVVMATRRRLHVKLRDFTHAKKLENKEEKITPAGYPDFIAPEILREEPAGFPADVWGLGALTFVLLSGTSPFGGADRQETLNKIMFDRYSVSDMYDNVSKEGISFVTKMLKRLPKNRATVNKCLDSKWLQLSDSMIKSRNSRLFRTETLRDFSELYLERRGDDQYMDMTGVSGETLAQPKVGPLTEPILSKKLPKYFRPIAKSSQDVELEIDSAESIASDFRSVLDKIEMLKEALDSGAELPERKNTRRKYLPQTSDISSARTENVKQDDLLDKENEVKALIIPEKATQAASVEDKKEAIPKSQEVGTRSQKTKIEKSVKSLENQTEKTQQKVRSLDNKAASASAVGKERTPENEIAKTKDKENIQLKDKNVLRNKETDAKKAENISKSSIEPKAGKSDAKHSSVKNDAKSASVKKEEIKMADNKKGEVKEESKDKVKKVLVEDKAKTTIDNKTDKKAKASKSSDEVDSNNVSEKDLKSKTDTKINEQKPQNSNIVKLKKQTEVMNKTKSENKPSVVEAESSSKRKDKEPAEKVSDKSDIAPTLPNKSADKISKVAALTDSQMAEPKEKPVESTALEKENNRSIAGKQKANSNENEGKEDNKLTGEKVSQSTMEKDRKKAEEKAVQKEEKQKAPAVPKVSMGENTRKTEENSDAKEEKQKAPSLPQPLANEGTKKVEEKSDAKEEQQKSPTLTQPSALPQPSVEEGSKKSEEKDIPKEDMTKPTVKAMSVEKQQNAVTDDSKVAHEKIISKEEKKNVSALPEPSIEAIEKPTEKDVQVVQEQEKLAAPAQLPVNEDIKQAAEEASPKEQEKQAQVSPLQAQSDGDTRMGKEKVIPKEEAKTDTVAPGDDNIKMVKAMDIPNEAASTVLHQGAVENIAKNISETENEEQKTMISKQSAMEEEKKKAVEQTIQIAEQLNENKQTPEVVVKDKSTICNDKTEGNSLEEPKNIGNIEKSSLTEKLETKPETSGNEVEIVEEVLIPIAVVKDKSMPHMSALSKEEKESVKVEEKENIKVIDREQETDNIEKPSSAAKPETKPGTSENEVEIIEEMVKPVSVDKDKLIPNVAPLSKDGNTAVSKEGKDSKSKEQKEPSEIQQKMATENEKIETELDRVETKEVEECNVPKEVIEEVMQSISVKKEECLPSLDIQENKNKEKVAPKEDTNKEDIEVKNISEEKNRTCELLDNNKLKTDVLKENTDSKNQTKSDSDTGLINNENVVDIQTAIVKELKSETEKDSLKECDANESAKDISAKAGVTEQISETIQESELDKRVNDLLEDEKRGSMSTASTVSEYLDALSCAENKDLKCDHNHESTPDSCYATPDRDIVKRDSVQEAEVSTTPETTDKSESTEKTDSESVKQRDDTPDLKDKQTDNITETEDQQVGEVGKDGQDTEKNKINAEVEQIADRLVSEVMDEALKVAEKSE